MNATVASAVQLVGRALMAYVFVKTGYANFGLHDQFVGMIAKNGFPVPEVTYWLAVATMFFGGLATLVGLQTRIAAVLLAIYCLWTAIQVHYVPGDVGQMTNFVKNLAIAGGFMQLLVAGPGAWSIDAMMARRR